MEKEYTLFNLSFLIIVALILIVLSASISFIIARHLVSAGDEQGTEIDGEIAEFTGVTVHLGSFTTDLKDSNRNRYIRVELSLEVEDEKAIEQISEREVQLQDKIISILRSKSSEELKGNEGKAALGEELIEGIEEFLSYKIINVYFNEFIIQ